MLSHGFRKGGDGDAAKTTARLPNSEKRLLRRTALKTGHYEGVAGTRSFRARGMILNSTGRRARGSPSTWVESGFLSSGSHTNVSAFQKWMPSVPRRLPIHRAGK